MTLKELRISKGLSQAECAAYLGMSVRNYQNYENNAGKANTAKYNAIYQKIEVYGKPDIAPVGVAEPGDFHTNVVTGISLQALTRRVEKYQKRDCFTLLRQFITRELDGKIGILYGLRRTGKTTLLFQMIRELPVEQTAYIKVKTTDNMSKLTKDLDCLNKTGCKYVFIDEITLMEDFINTAAVLSDIYAMMGMKIVVSGTDSLGFAMANRDELYDRSVTIHTSFIPFREYSRLLGIDSVDSYIEYGGTLKMENMSFNDPDSTFDDVSFRDDESTRKYIDSAISRNIQHTLKNDNYGEYFNQLRELYDKGELTNVINRIVESMNHQFLLRVVQEEFKSHDLGSSRELLLREAPAERAHVLYDVDTKAIVERLKAIIEIKERCETTIEITQEHIEKVKKYLFMLDLIVNCTERHESRAQSEHTVFSQPGMRYSIAKALVYSLGQDEYFQTVSEIDKQYIITKILDDVKGKMLEDIVLLETYKAASRSQDVFKFKFDIRGEYDMVIYDRDTNTCRIYEVKHSDKIVPQQTRFLRMEELNEITEKRFGKITGKYVIYRGDTQDVDGIQYVNVEQYLKSL
ncbi:MAG: AAA family ATPase [Clostridia bacterium]|nr:AAA family ATPase [Clostridia bacterium]